MTCPGKRHGWASGRKYLLLWIICGKPHGIQVLDGAWGNKKSRRRFGVPVDVDVDEDR